MNEGELRAICELTFCLTELRREGCAHLCIENFAPDLFGKLIKEYRAAHAAAPINTEETA